MNLESLNRIIGFGAMNLDLFYSVERVVIDGEVTVKSVARRPGGSAANTVYGLARLGVKSGFVGATGNDGEGQFLRRSFESAGVDISRISIKVGAPTGAVLALTDLLGHRALYVSPGANSFLGPEDVDLAYLNQASIVHFSAFVSDNQFQLQNDVSRRLAPGVKLSLAPGALYAARGFQSMKALLSRTHTLFLNRAEMKQLTGRAFREGAGLCLAESCRQIVVTLGKGARIPGVKGNLAAYVRDSANEYFIPAARPPAQVVDTTGAGDAFAAGFLYGLLLDKDPYRCGMLGALVASFSLTAMGARDGLPTREQLLAALPATGGKA
ncbi:MAG: carbohydrate kinase family protein [Chloroflexi bacterium]|nr:carbohydrate kinase family protein [Chloroflexota bacterium]